MKEHLHEVIQTDKGLFAKCYHTGRELLLNWRFWLGLTMGFPLEHMLWEHVPPFNWIAKYLGMIQ